MKEVQDRLFPTQVHCSRSENSEHVYQLPCGSDGKAEHAVICAYKSLLMCLWLSPLDISETNIYHDVLWAGHLELHLSFCVLQGKIIKNL